MTAFTPPAVVTIDAGSGSCRALVFDATGELLGLAQREWNYRPVADAPGGFDFDPNDGWDQVSQCVREALHTARVSADEVAAVTAASMREGFVLYDEAGREIWACPNIDARAGVEATEMIAEGLAQSQYERGGDWTSITAPARLRWIRRHQPDILDRARHLTMLGDWVIARLCGVFCYRPVARVFLQYVRPRDAHLVTRDSGRAGVAGLVAAGVRGGHGGGRSQPGGRGGNGAAAGNGRRRRGGGHAACAAGGGFDRGAALRHGGGHLLADGGGDERTGDRPPYPAAHAVPHPARHVDDRGDRVSARVLDALGARWSAARHRPGRSVPRRGTRNWSGWRRTFRRAAMA